MKTYYISRITCRDFSVFLTLQTIFTEQKKRSRGRKMRWEKKRQINKRKTKSSTSVRGTYAATKRCRAKHLLSQKMQIRDVTSAADSAKSVIFTAAASPQRTHTLQTICAVCVRVCGQNTETLSVLRLHMHKSQLVCALRRVLLSIWLTLSLLMSRKPHEGSDVRSQSSWCAGLGQICRVCSLCETRHLCLPVLSLTSLSSSLLFSVV